MEVFCNHTKEEAKRLLPYVSSEQRKEFSGVTECHICLECFKPWDEKVRDHCNYTGKYRDAAHQKCNL